MKKRDVIAGFLGVLYLINFASFAIVAGHIGGSADMAQSGAGHYYVSAHGHYTEVSHKVYIYSFWHWLAVVVNFAAFGLSAVVAGLSRKSTRCLTAPLTGEKSTKATKQ